MLIDVIIGIVILGTATAMITTAITQIVRLTDKKPEDDE